MELVIYFLIGFVIGAVITAALISGTAILVVATRLATNPPPPPPPASPCPECVTFQAVWNAMSIWEKALVILSLTPLIINCAAKGCPLRLFF